MSTAHDLRQGLINRNMNIREYGDIEYEAVEDNILKDKQDSKFLYITFFLLGVAMLLPWNVFITATTFFKYKFTGSRFELNFNSFFSMVGTIANLIFLFYSLATQRQTKLYERAWSNILKLTLCFIFMVLFVYTNFSSIINFIICILLLFISVATASFINSDGLGLAATFGTRYVQAALLGQALAGLAVAFAQLFISSNSSEANGEQQILNMGFFYFLIALMCMLSTMITFYMLKKHSRYIVVQDTFVEDDDVDFIQNVKNQYLSCKILFKKHYYELFALCFIFLVTLSLFPAITTLVNTSGKQSFVSKYFLELHFVIYNLGDMIGRYLPTIAFFYIDSEIRIFIYSLSRIVFIPVIMLCNISISNSNYHYFNNDLIFFLIILLFSISNGYLSTMSMILAPSKCTPHLKGTMASLMVLTLTLGLSLGSLVSFIWYGILCNCNPF